MIQTTSNCFYHKTIYDESTYYRFTPTYFYTIFFLGAFDSTNGLTRGILSKLFQHFRHMNDNIENRVRKHISKT